MKKHGSASGHWIHRVGTARSGFRYFTESGARVTRQPVLDRIVALRIPPAYADVRIAVDPRAAIQAWGFDVRGRRQYRYHARAVERSELRKLHTAMILAEVGPAATPREARGNVLTAIRIVAAALGNTPAVCRRSYVHPIVPGLYIDRGLTIAERERGPRPAQVRRSRSSAHIRDPWVPFSREEKALARFLLEHFPDRRRTVREQPLRQRVRPAA